MGTSKSHGGPNDRKPLLPLWAFPATNNDLPPVNNPPDELVPDDSDQQITTPVYPWRAAKTKTTKLATSGRNGRTGIKKAGRAYVAAKGGARKAASLSVSGKLAAARIGSFFSAVSTIGIQNAFTRFHLGELVGANSEIVFARIVNILAPEGMTREETAARKAVNDAMNELYERFILSDNEIANLNMMTSEDIKYTMENCISSYIYYRWLEELGSRIEKGSISEDSAVALERQMKIYIRELVTLQIDDIDVLTVDWEGGQGQELIENAFENAYSIMEDGE